MARVAPYYSTDQTDPDVYHWHSNCPNGQQIPAKNKASGTGGNRKCKSCEKLGG
jgi:hypothetical protein